MSLSRRVGRALPRRARRRAQAQGHPVDRGSPPVRPARPVAPERAQLRRLLPRPGAARRPRDHRRADARAARAARARCTGPRRGARARRRAAGIAARDRAAAAPRGPRARGAARDVALHPFVPRTALELGAALFPWRARPGVAIEIVRRVAEDARSARGRRRARSRRTTCSTTSRARPACRRS